MRSKVKIRLSTLEAIGAVVLGSSAVVVYNFGYINESIVLIAVATVFAVHAHYSWKVND